MKIIYEKDLFSDEVFELEDEFVYNLRLDIGNDRSVKLIDLSSIT